MGRTKRGQPACARLPPSADGCKCGYPCDPLAVIERDRASIDALHRLRVGAQVDLKPSIEQKTVLEIGADAPADRIGSFQQNRLHARLVEALGGVRSRTHDVT